MLRTHEWTNKTTLRAHHGSQTARPHTPPTKAAPLLLLILLTSLTDCGGDPTPPGPTPIEDCDSVLPYTSLDRSPAFSKDGNTIAFFSFIDSGGATQAGIYLTDTNGSTRQWTKIQALSSNWLIGDTTLVVNTGLVPGFPPLETSITQTNGTNTQTLPLTTRFSIVTAHPNDPSFFYTGPMIDSTYATGIYRYHLQTDSISALFGGETPAVNPADTNELVYRRDGIRLYSFQDSTETLLINDSFARFPVWSSDGTSLIYETAPAQLMHYDIPSHTASLITCNGLGPVTIHPTQDLIVYTGPDSNGQTRLWLTNFDGSLKRQVTQ